MHRNDSQWAAQFVVAAELIRRGYSVAFYHGNHPVHDMPVRGQTSQNSFDLQIKGTQYGPAKKPSKKQGAVGTVVFVGKLQGGKPTDLFIIVYTPFTKYATTPSLGKPFLFYIATRQELQAIKNPGKQQPKFTTDWVSYRDLKQHENCWNKLPAP